MSRTAFTFTAAASLLLACASPAPERAADPVADVAPVRTTLIARGNEPAWSLRIDQSLRFESGELHVSGPAKPVVVTDAASGSRQRYAAALRDRALAVSVEVLTVPRVCRDSMSGMPYPLAVEVLVGERRFSGCGGDPGALLRTGDWTLVELVGAAVTNAAPTLRFGADGRVAGYAGCNRYHAAYTLGGETLTIGRAASTRMACPAQQMAQEQRFLELLSAVRRFDIADDGSLLLIGEAGQVVRARR